MLCRRIALAAIVSGFILVSTAAAASPQPIVIGYAPAFKGLDNSVLRKDIAGYTHINIAFANPDRHGAFVGGDAMTCMPDETRAMTRLNRLRDAVSALQAKGLKVLVSVAGGVIPQCSGDWAALLVPERRAATVTALVELVERAGLDGLDVDIEGTLLASIDEAGNYTPFIAALAEELHRRGKLLTCATASYEGGMIPEGSIPFFDFVNVMSYDAIGPSWGPAGAEHSPYSTAVRDLALWRAHGVPKERLILGVPFYGYGFGSERPNWTYSELAARNPAQAAAGDTIGTPCAGCTYITFNGPRTIERKASLAAEQAGGVMVWEVTQDTDDGILLKTILKVLEEAGRDRLEFPRSFAIVPRE